MSRCILQGLRLGTISAGSHFLILNSVRILTRLPTPILSLVSFALWFFSTHSSTCVCVCVPVCVCVRTHVCSYVHMCMLAISCLLFLYSPYFVRALWLSTLARQQALGYSYIKLPPQPPVLGLKDYQTSPVDSEDLTEPMTLFLSYHLCEIDR